MSGGRGGPKTGLSFNAELLGIGRGKDGLPTTVLAPPPVFPPMTAKAKQPLKSDESDYLLALSKEYLLHMRDSCFFLKHNQPLENKILGVKVERYSDRFQEHVQKPMNVVDWNRFPKELSTAVKKRSVKRKVSVKPNLVSKVTKKDVLQKLEALEATEGKEPAENEEGEEGEKEDGDGEDKEEEETSEIEEDEELDEGTDYANNYFDNGEGYLDEDDDGQDEGGIY